jgi:hypothetical protein
MNSLATYWIVPSAPQHLFAVKTLGSQGKIDRAATEAVKAVEADPSNAAARGFHALSLNEAGHDEEAIKEAEPREFFSLPISDELSVRIPPLQRSGRSR